MSRPVRAVVLDLDDTMFDHSGSVRRALAAWLPATASAGGEPLMDAWFALEQKHYREWEAGRISFPEQRRRRLRDFFELLGLPTGSDDEADALFAAYLHCHARAWSAFDDVHPALAELRRRGVRLAVLTNGSTVQQHAKVEALGLREHLEAVVTSEELGVAKPDPAAYLAVCARLGVDPAEALHVGDRYDVDVVGARGAGLQALHLDRSGRSAEPSDDRIRSLAELPGRLDQAEVTATCPPDHGVASR